MADLTTPPDFINETPASILKHFTEDYQTRAGKIVQPAQPEQLLINSVGFEAYLNALRIQSAAEQNLIQFATGSNLDFRVRDFGVVRLPAAAASCSILLTLVPGHGDLIIPAGLRVQSVDGLATFVLENDVIVSSIVDTYTVNFICDTPGIVGNGYIAGKVSVILDPKAYLSTAANTNTTAGGSDIETDEHLRDRFYLAPNSFGSAGSEGAYKYFAKSASALILDVTVNNGGGGVVNIYPLVAGDGTTPQQILDDVEAACSPKQVRPLTDTVNAVSPSAVTYAIDVDIISYASADQNVLQDAIESALQKMADDNAKLLGLDIVISQIIAAASISGVYKVSVVSPVADVSLDNTEVSICTAVNVTITGTNNDK